jgi:hypothetical protein
MGPLNWVCEMRAEKRDRRDRSPLSGLCKVGTLGGHSGYINGASKSALNAIPAKLR